MPSHLVGVEAAIVTMLDGHYWWGRWATGGMLVELYSWCLY
jgi:hypothetical protein